ncbi:MAG: alanine racemase [Candidatus Hydrothermia bacterium]
MTLNWIEISREALIHNLNVIKNKAQGKKILAMVKSNAYGHGLIEVSTVIKDEVEALVVGDLDEGLSLYEKIKDKKIILSLAPLDKEGLEESAEKGFELFAGNLEHLKFIKTLPLKKPLGIHLEINTGMNRTGIDPERIEEALDLIYHSENMTLKGIFSHFATLPVDLNFAKKQAQIFRATLSRIKIPQSVLIHMENSSGILNLLLDITGGVRPGISLYGLTNSETNLKPVLSLRSKIIDIIKVRKGEGISYDHIFRARDDMWAATIPFGYGNGYMWNLKGKAEVIVSGTKLPVVGKICMNHMVIDVTPVINKIRLGETVTLIGKDGTQEITVNELAEKSGTINYEIVSKLSPFIKRVIV